MSPTDSFRPTLSLPVEQAMSFLSLASRRIPEAEQLDTARDLGVVRKLLTVCLCGFYPGRLV